MESVDALVIGRKTYETVLAFETWPYNEKPVFVLSTRPLAPAPAGAVVEHLSGDPAEIVSQLDTRGIKHVYVDGGITIQGSLRAGLIQRLIITRVPVLIGDGVSLFGSLPHDVRLEHVATRYRAVWCRPNIELRINNSDRSGGSVFSISDRRGRAHGSRFKAPVPGYIVISSASPYVAPFADRRNRLR